jgi:hypothetical protein
MSTPSHVIVNHRHALLRFRKMVAGNCHVRIGKHFQVQRLLAQWVHLMGYARTPIFRDAEGTLFLHQLPRLYSNLTLSCRFHSLLSELLCFYLR